MNVIRCACCLLLLPLLASTTMGQTGQSGARSDALAGAGNISTEASAPPEIVVRLSLAGVGEMDIIALQRDTVLYIPVLELFAFLQINAEPSVDGTRISGFFINPDTRYIIDPNSAMLNVGMARYTLSEDNALILYSDIFLATELYQRAFGITLDFDPVHLLVRIRSSLIFPVQAALNRVRSRSMISEVQLPPADLTLGRDRRLLSGGTLDWQLGAVRNSIAGNSGSVVARAGAELLGGDISGTFNANSETRVDWNRMPWRWRYTADEGPWFRQAIVGWLSSDLGLRQSLRGATINSNWYTLRREFENYRVELQAFAGDEIELYKGNRLMDVIRVETTGSVTLDLPLLYGANLYTLRRSSPAGLIQEEVLRIDIPFGTLPAGEVQYKVCAGELQNRPGSGLAEGFASLGLGKHVTVGAGVQMQRHAGDRMHPALFFSSRLIDNLWLDASTLVDAVTAASASWESMNNISVRGSYQHFNTHPLYNPGEPRSDYRLGLSVPVGFMPIRSWFSVYGQHQQIGRVDNTNLFSILNLGSGFFSAQVTTQARWSKLADYTDIEQNLTVFYQLLPGMTVNAGISYNYEVKNFTAARASIYSHLSSNMYATATWYAQLQRGYSQLQVSVHWRLPEASLESRGDYQTANGAWIVQQRAYGTIGYDRGAGELLFNDQPWTDRSAVTLLPFLDENADDLYNDGETLLGTPMMARMDRGQRFRSSDDNEARFVNLDQYDSYRITVDPASFADPVWVSNYKNIDIVADPNQFKPVYLPVYQGGEVQGSVSRVSDGDTVGVRGMRVYFKRLDRATKEENVATYSDGTFSHFGLHPGSYEVRIDTAKARTLGYTVEPLTREFTLESKEFGDLVENLNFYLRGKPEVRPKPEIVDPSRIERLPDSAIIVLPPITKADTIAEPPDAVPRDTAAIAFVPVPFDITQRLPIDLSRRDLDSTTKAWLDRLLRTTRDLDRYSVSVEGHSDNFGDFQTNQRRSGDRAAKILDYLLKGGMPRRNIQVQSFGSRRPVESNTSAEGRRKNNRGEVTLRRGTRGQGQIIAPTPPAIDSTVFRAPDVPDPSIGSTTASANVLVPAGARSLDAAAQTRIDQIIRNARASAGYIIQVDGHSDNFGTLEENQRRSQERADLVLRYLLKEDIPRERIQVQAFGSRRPAASNRTADGRRQNNRVELRVIGP